MKLCLWPCLVRGLPNDWPKARSPSQRYIMLSIDPPVKLYEYRRLERLGFNWTMTYRLDSTFPMPYSTVERVLPLPAEPGSAQVCSLALWSTKNFRSLTFCAWLNINEHTKYSCEPKSSSDPPEIRFRIWNMVSLCDPAGCPFHFFPLTDIVT